MEQNQIMVRTWKKKFGSLAELIHESCTSLQLQKREGNNEALRNPLLHCSCSNEKMSDSQGKIDHTHFGLNLKQMTECFL